MAKWIGGPGITSAEMSDTCSSCFRVIKKMSFYFSDTAVLLFDFWSVHSPTGMALSVLVIVLLSVLYEAIKMGKAVLLRRALLAVPRNLSQESLAEPEEEESNNPTQGGFGTTSARRCSTWCRWFWATW
ncbi:probable low affinity copper uptake protein 2 isoform X3 [Cuculus canorus]|uniref:probable low affinity copper uptake protein 2 isoform X3 n=1 Tax=Cuculus canorus TaxID=55661 RepID=UPI0023AA2873|nr:probable low affinity copper uptake protein 2 isoform X3 [Cuculus canorus]